MITFFFHVLFDGQCDDPLASLLIAGVFPLWSDSFLEHQIVSVRYDLAHRVNVIIHFPKVLDLNFDQ